MSKPLGPYSPVVRAGDFVIVSGQGGMADGKVVEGGVSAETTQTMKNLATQLATVGASLSDIVKTTHSRVRRISVMAGSGSALWRPRQGHAGPGA